jgi:S-DNA-T family DNA segregation ATPase FtsK/SpoIIIE
MSGGGGYGKVLGRSLWTIVGHPRVGIVFVLTLAAWAFVSGTILVLSLVLLTVGATTLTAYRPHLVVDTVKGRHRRWWGYGRRWSTRAAKCGLSVGNDVAKLRSVEQHFWGERVLIGPPDGLSPEDAQKSTARLASTFQTKSCRVKEIKPGKVWALEFSDGRALRDPIPAPPISATTDLERLLMGKREDGKPWTIRVFHPERGYQHLFVAGTTGAGKSKLFWQAIREMAPGVRDGLVELRVLDPKGGIEFGRARGLCAAYADEEKAMAELLAQCVVDMRARGARMKAAGISQHTPIRSEPAVGLFVDEIVSLLTDCEDPRLAKQMERDLRIVLRQGRAYGFFVWAATQDARIENFPLRPFFPNAVGLRLMEANQADKVFGKGARDAGATCDLIDKDCPGQGFEITDEGTMLVRGFFVSEQQYTDLIRDYAINAEDTAEVKARVAKLDEIALAAEFEVDDDAAEDDDVGEEAGV